MQSIIEEYLKMFQIIILDIVEDKKLGKPSVICRKCCTVIITFDQFKRSVQEGQRKLEDIVERRRIRDEKRREEEEQKGVRFKPYLSIDSYLSNLS